jgi:hypothetical protein
MHEFFKVIEWLRWPIGFILAYAAVFVREDEEGALQNLLEAYWIRLMYAKEKAS